jgi:hypothetical protein
MVSFDCATIVAVSLLSSRLPIEEVLWALNTNVPCIGGDVTEFHQYHVDEIWQYIRSYHPDWFSFAVALPANDDPRIDRGVERLRNGCLHGWRDLYDGDVYYDKLMMTYERIVNPYNEDVEYNDESEYYRGDEYFAEDVDYDI